MINLNGALQSATSPLFSVHNRGFLYGDAVFETLRYSHNQLHFWEDHYFRLMAAMRVFRMSIPMSFTPELLEQECIRVVEAQSTAAPSWRIRLSVFRNDGGVYLPDSPDVSYVIEAKPLEDQTYISKDNYKVELFKDYYVQKSMLSNLKSNNKALNIIGSIFMQEQGFDNGILVNDDKEVVEFLNGNLFVVDGEILRTPPLSSGCLDGIMRKQVIRLAKKQNITCIEEKISPFDLQQVQEVFMTNSIAGIQPASSYRRTDYQNTIALQLQHALNELVNSGQDK
ncbi:MAG: Branched-chain-amino-acid aminotransferase [Bacteroidota bacterium]|nr:MAG: Branched-chain-amino-acid aminotransferase [Bacteroidota bacterium]